MDAVEKGVLDLLKARNRRLSKDGQTLIITVFETRNYIELYISENVAENYDIKFLHTDKYVRSMKMIWLALDVKPIKLNEMLLLAYKEMKI